MGAGQAPMATLDFFIFVYLFLQFGKGHVQNEVTAQ